MSAPTYAPAWERFPTVRQSRLATFDRCALSADFEERYERNWSSHPQARGQLMHRAFAKALRAMSVQYESEGYDESGARPGTIPTDVGVSILEEVLCQADVDQECPTCHKEIVRTYQRDDGEIRTVCAQGHDHGSEFVNVPFQEIKDMRWVMVKWCNENAFDIANLIDVEHRLSATIRYQDPSGEYVERVLTGALDVMFVTGAEDEEAIVIDWKDTWDLPGPAEVGFDGYFQQRFYAWLVFKKYPSVKKVTLREFYVRRSEAREAVVYRSEIEDVEAELRALVQRFDRAFTLQVFPPSPGRHCLLCTRPAACPIFPGVRGEGMIQDDEQAVRMAGEAQVAEAALKQRKEAMSAWASVHKGGIPVSDHKGQRVWGHKEIKRTSRPDRKAMEAALRASRNGAPLDLDRLYKTSKGTRFEVHQPAEIDDAADDAVLMSALDQSLDAVLGRE